MILAITEMIVKHGVPAALQIIKAWDIDEPTLEDIEALRQRVPEFSWKEGE